MNKNMRFLLNVQLWLGLCVIAGASLAADNPESIPSTAESLEPGLSISRVIELAGQQSLARSIDWLSLLHYRQPLLSAAQSQADDDDFFLSEQGAVDAKAELLALIRALWGEDRVTGQAILCRFPARSSWLNRRIPIPDDLSEQRCDAFLKWKQSFEATGLTLLFPSMYLNNPASMFGHTFLRFDNEKSELLRPTLSYAAQFDEADAFLVYAWKGLSGGYPGRFSVQPYYETLLEYSDIEQRDIWEYSLNLTEAEIAQLVRHLWEVKGIHFEYFFLRENCSYRLLALFDVARPGLGLSFSSHPVFAAPLDVVRDVIDAGLVKHSLYRPARATRLVQMSTTLGESSSDIALNIAAGENIDTQLAEQQNMYDRARILRFADELMTHQGNVDPQRQHRVLSTLSQLGLSAEQTAFPFSATPPELSHDTSRWLFSAGELERQRYYELGLRPVFHDVLDDSKALLKGSSVNFLETRLRWWQDEQKLELSQLQLFEIRSLTGVTPWQRNVSKQLSFELVKRDELVDATRVFKSELGLGYAYQSGALIASAMASLRLDYSHKLKQSHAGFMAAQFDLLWQPDGTPVQLHLALTGYQQLSGEPGDVHEAAIGLQYNLPDQHALRLEASWLEYLEIEHKNIKFSYLYYF